jgi:hypothetical protein
LVILVVVEQVETADLEAAAVAVETTLVVAELPVKVMLVENLNQNLHQLMIEVAVEAVQEPQEVME